MSEKIRLKGQLKLPVVGKNPTFAQMKFVKVALSEPDILPDSGSIFTCDEQGNYDFEIYTGAHLLSYNVGNAWSKPIEIIAEPLAEGLESIEISDLIGFQEIPELDATIAALNQQKQELLAIQQDVIAKQTAVTTAADNIDSTVADVEAGYPSLLAAQLSKTVVVNAATGDDSTADGSSAKPFKTIKAAIESQPDLIALTVNLVGGDTELTSHKIDSTIVCGVRKLTISCSTQHITFSGDYVFSVNDGGSVIAQATVALHIHCTSALAILVLSVGSTGCRVMNVRFYLNSDASFAFMGYTSLSGYNGISNLVTSNVSMINYADKTTPAAYSVSEHHGLSGSVIAIHWAGSFGSNYQNTAIEATLAGNLKAISK